jgi:hypothetical protein
MPPRRNLMRDDAYAYSGSSRTGGNDPRWETADATSPDKRQRARADVQHNGKAPMGTAPRNAKQGYFHQAG